MFSKAKNAIIKAHKRISRSSLFDLYNQQKSAKLEATQAKVNIELLVFFKKLKIWMQDQKIELTKAHYLPTYSTSHQGIIVAPNPAIIQNFFFPNHKINDVFHQDIQCYNCIKKKHYLTSCLKPKILYKQRKANKNFIDKTINVLSKQMTTAQI